MGLLDRYMMLMQGMGGAQQMIPGMTQAAPPAQQPQPFAAPQTPSLQAPPTSGQLTPVAPAPPPLAFKPPSFGDRFNTMISGDPATNTPSVFDRPLFQGGMALLANSQNGGDMSAAVNQFQGMRQQTDQRNQMQRQNRREDTADTREQTQFGWQQEEQGLRQQRVADWRRAIEAEQDPAKKSQLLAIGPDQYAQFISNQQQQEFQAREGQLDRDAQVRAAQVRSANENSLGRYFQSMDAQTLGEQNQAAAQLQAVGLPQLRQLRTTIQQAGTSLTGQPIDYNNRITLGRLFNGSTEDRQTLEVWRAQILGPALETLRGLGAMSEREMEAAVNSFSNPNMTLGSAMQLIDEKISTAERRVSQAQATSEFFSSAGGITGVRNAEGQDYATFLQSRLGDTPGAGGNGENVVPRGGYGAPPAAAIQDLRRDTSAEARREFDQVFGPGASARALGGGGRGAARPGSNLTGGRDARANQGPREGQTRAVQDGRYTRRETYRNGRWVRD
jgi:hypothetical protein